MENKFKKGLILGGLLSIAAAVGIFMNKEGSTLSKDLQQNLKDLAKHLKKNLHQLEDITKESYDALVADVIEEFAMKKIIANDSKKSLTSSLQAMWKEMEIEYLTGIEKNNFNYEPFIEATGIFQPSSGAHRALITTSFVREEQNVAQHVLATFLPGHHGRRE